MASQRSFWMQCAAGIAALSLTASACSKQAPPGQPASGASSQVSAAAPPTPAKADPNAQAAPASAPASGAVAAKSKAMAENLAALGYVGGTTSAQGGRDRRAQLIQGPAQVQPMAPPPPGLARAEKDARIDSLGSVIDSEWNTEQYARIVDNPFLAVAQNPLSTFSVDVDRASYSNVRRFLNEGRLPPKDAVRIEELVNYFSYDYPEPGGRDPFSVTTEVSEAPWNPRHRIARIGLKARSVDMKDIPAGNLVFLVDVSGSMAPADKLPLLKSSFAMLVDQLRPQDRVAIVVYAGSAGLVLPSTPGSKRGEILDALEALEAGGSTAGGEGIRLAYKIAAENHIEGGNNRVILATDGDFNVGVSSDAEMVRLIEEKRRQGTFLTVLGFGTGNLQDAKMEQIADKGNGHYAYIDGLLEARKVLVGELGGTLLTVAKDVKLQVEFNPARVAAYRLIGYENRLMRDEDFNDDAKDAGDVGAGHTVTALYEIVPVGAEGDVKLGTVDPLRYATGGKAAGATGGDELFFVKLRYKDPDGETSRLLEHTVADAARAPSEDLRFAAAVAEFGMLLRDSEHKGSSSFDDVLTAAGRAAAKDASGLRAEFVRLAGRARELSAQKVAANTRDRR